MAVKGHVDGMLGSYVIGWALATPDHGNCAIVIKDSAGAEIASGRASRHRGDLASLGAGRTTLSFRIPIKNDVEPRQLHVFADGAPLAGSPITTGAGQYDGDAVVDRATVSGWVTERTADFAPPTITVVNQHGVIVARGASAKDPGEPDVGYNPAHFSLELADQCFGCGELRLSVLADGVKFAERSATLLLDGNLETVSANFCAGWMVAPDAPQRCFSIEVYRDGELAGTGICDIVRDDVIGVYPEAITPAFSVTLSKPSHAITQAATISLRFAGADTDLFKGPYVVGSRAAAVLAAQRVAGLAYQHIPGMGAAERAVLQLAIKPFLAEARGGDGFAAAQQALEVRASHHTQNQPAPRLTILIPIYRGVEVTRACILSVLATRDPADHVVLINDASPDAEMLPLLNSFVGVPKLFLLNNEANLGFVKTVNRGMAFSLGSDVLMLNSDTVVYPGGFDEICRVAAAHDDIGTVTAMSNNATIFSYPHVSLRSEVLEDIAWEDLAHTALVENAGVTIDVPTGHGFCMLIKGEVLRRLGFLDEGFGRGYGEENDLCMRAANLGYRHVIAAGALVQHRESISFVGEKASLLARNLPRLNGMYPEYTPVIMTFEDQDGMRRARWALDRARLRNARLAGQSFVLVVTNALDGGTAKAIKDIEEAAGYQGATRLTLRSQDNGYLELLGDTPAIWASFAPDEIDDLFEVIGAAEPTHVLVHQLLGFPAAFISQLGSFAPNVRSIYYVHDFYPLCPRVTMIDAIGRFCDVADTDTCARCVEMGGSHESSKLTRLTPAAHRALFATMLGGFRRVIAPSANAAGYMRRAFPNLAISAVPHPETAQDIAVEPRAGTDDEIVLFGAIGPHKGSGKLFEIAQRARLTHPHLQFRVIGYTNMDRQLTALGNVTITGKYKAEKLPALIAETRGRLALFLAAWPETYSYTLSEAAKHGFIPLVPDIGAPAERVRQAQYGVVFPFPADPAQVLALIDSIAAGSHPAYAEGALPASLYPTAAQIQLTIESLAPAVKVAKARKLVKT